MIKLLILALGVYQAQASYSVYNGESGLYSNYHGEYAASYDNYIPKPYAFEYGVSDPHTGDHKSQWETKDTAGVVRGSYSLLEPDGTTRVVDYIADKAGFRAVVKRVNIHGYTSVESHGGVEPLGQIIAAEPIAPVILPQPELVVKQPDLYNEHRQIFSSYDGGAEDYQNLLPLQLPVLQGVPIGILSQEKHVAFASQSPSIYNHQQPQDIILHQPEPELATYNRPQPLHELISPKYQQPIKVYRENLPEIKSYQQVEPVSSYYQSVPYEQLSSNPTYEHTISDTVLNQNIAPAPAPAYSSNLPVDGYKLETVYGQETVGYDPNSLGSQSNSVYHPHGKSSQSFAGSTGYQEGVQLHH